ncbi:MAG: hypothetical protein GOMPHAMPRED_006164 [Gomphillus americanus]|uniref:SGNH hydrolase-type esterase domain-containing protein n=1 Tax=Gomphillus americanus TaxID=1940652 RepID=A0A8H3EQ40_9LECA|nr:MAG: hypothetical protein GOMPHAMPRED_006164 [Gomphillus americanus]
MFSGTNFTDSITWGYGSTDWNGYRQFLLTMLEGNQVEFIGSGHTGRMYNNANEGRPGELLNQTMKFSSHILYQRPNVILLNIASNDIALSEELDTILSTFKTLLDEILEICPDAVIVLSPLGPSTNSIYQTRMDDFNRKMPTIVERLVSQGRHVLLADIAQITIFDLFDDFHYKDDGYSKLALAFYMALDIANLNGWIRDPVKIPRRELVLSTACESLPDWINLPDIFPGFQSPPDDAHYLWGDVDGNSREDLLVLAPDGQLQPYLNSPMAMPEPGKVIDWQIGNRIQTPASPTSSGSPVLLTADLTGANRASLIYVYLNGSIFASSNLGPELATGEPIFKPQVLIADTTQAPADAQGIRFADFDGDGRDDLAYLFPSGILQVWLNTANLHQHSFAEPDPEVLNIKWVDQGQIVGKIPGISRDDVRLVDLNGDGLADFLLVDPQSGTVEAWFNRGVDDWYRTSSSSLGQNPRAWVASSPPALRPGARSAIDAAKGAARDLAQFWKSSIFSRRRKAVAAKSSTLSSTTNTDDDDDDAASHKINPRVGIDADADANANANSAAAAAEEEEEEEEEDKTNRVIDEPVSSQTQRTQWRWEELGVIIEGSDDRDVIDDNNNNNTRVGVGAPGVQFADIAGSRRASYLFVEQHGRVWGWGNGCGGQGAGWGWNGD